MAASNVVSVAVGMFAGLALADVSEGAIKWLHDWQTLITGGMAVGAAGLTVAAMHLTDARQQLRHVELIKLNTRRDKLRVMRAANPRAKALRNWADLSDGMVADFKAVYAADGSDGLESEKLFEFWGHLQIAPVRLAAKELLQDVELFDAELRDLIQASNTAIQSALTTLHSNIEDRAYMFAAGSGRIEKLPGDHQYVRDTRAALPFVRASISYFRELADALEALVKLYD
jgi:hypothetical protein